MSGLVWLASYPRSGNTWLRAVLTGVCSGADAAIDINRLEGPEIASSRRLVDEALGIATADLTESEIPHFRRVAYRYLARQEKAQRFIKIHDTYQSSADVEPIIPLDVSSRIIYVVRNPLDMAVSAAYFGSAAIDQVMAHLSDHDFSQSDVGQVLSQQLPQHLGSWSQHVAGWLDQVNIPVLAVRYEDMLGKPEATFGQVCQFSGLPTGNLSVAIRNADFNILRAQERAAGFRERPHYTKTFFRQGVSGGWRTELSATHVHRIIDDHGPMMRRLGYLSASGEIVDFPEHSISKEAQVPTSI